jgi:maleamate amidohydrolase
VRATIVDAFSYGFRVQVLADCCGDAEEGPHNDALRDVGRRYADVTDRASVEAWIRATVNRGH